MMYDYEYVALLLISIKNVFMLKNTNMISTTCDMYENGTLERGDIYIL